jgi:hypothetical protein
MLYYYYYCCLLAKTLHKEDKLYKYIIVRAIGLSRTKKGLTG